MPSTYDMLKARREEILALAAKHGATRLRVFGSVVRGEEQADSDIDWLVQLAENRDYFDLVELQLDLEDMLGRPCDVISEGGLYWLLRDSIMNEAQPL